MNSVNSGHDNGDVCDSHGDFGIGNNDGDVSNDGAGNDGDDGFK